MRIQHVPLLLLQRDLYRLPHEMDRFRQYLRTMVHESGDDLALPPLVVMNPMAREHVPQLIDEYLGQNADDVAATAIAQVESELADVPGEFRLALVAYDDLLGGWTNRYATEYSLRCGNHSREGKRALERSAWITAPLWSSERASVDQLRVEILATAFVWPTGPSTARRGRSARCSSRKDAPRNVRAARRLSSIQRISPTRGK